MEPAHTPLVRTALITGASSGIGLVTALRLSRAGWSVFAGLRAPERAPAALACAGVRVLQLDVTNAAQGAAAVAEVIAQAGRIDGLVCNAGVQLRGYFEDLSDGETRALFATNLYGAMALVRAALPHMRAARRGRIVLVSSVGGRLGAPAMSAYCASKFALEGFGEALALELAALGIRVAIVAPAIVATPIWMHNRATALASAPYAASFAALEALSNRLVASAELTSDDVARCIWRALSDRRPRLRYVVGRRASLLLALRRLLPGELFERIYIGTLARFQERAAALAHAEASQWQNS